MANSLTAPVKTAPKTAQTAPVKTVSQDNDPAYLTRLEAMAEDAASAHLAYSGY